VLDYYEQRHSKLLAQFALSFHHLLNTHMKMGVQVNDCRINNANVHFVPSCHNMRMQIVDVPSKTGKFSNIVCSIITCLVAAIFRPKTA